MRPRRLSPDVGRSALHTGPSKNLRPRGRRAARFSGGLRAAGLSVGARRAAIKE